MISRMEVARAQPGGKGGNAPGPETEKIVENGVISEGSIFSNKFSKKIKIKNSIFLQKFQQKNFKISQQCVFHPNAQKLNAEFANLFEKSAKIMHFWQFSEEKNFKDFLKIYKNCLFPPNAKKINAWLFNFLKNMLK